MSFQVTFNSSPPFSWIKGLQKKENQTELPFLRRYVKLYFYKKGDLSKKAGVYHLSWVYHSSWSLGYSFGTAEWHVPEKRRSRERRKGRPWAGSSPPAAAVFLLPAMLRLLLVTSDGLRQKAIYCRSHVKPFAFTVLYRRAICFKSRWKIVSLVISWVWSPRSATRLRRAGSLSPDVSSSRRIKAIKSRSLGGVTHRREVVWFLSAWLTALEQMKRRWRELCRAALPQRGSSDCAVSFYLRRCVKASLVAVVYYRLPCLWSLWRWHGELQMAESCAKYLWSISK